MKRILATIVVVLLFAAGFAFAAADPQINSLAKQGLAVTDEAADKGDKVLLALIDAGKQKDENIKLVSDQKKKIDTLQARLDNDDKWVGRTGLITGGLIFVGGVLYFFFGEKPGGIKLMAAGLLVACVSYAFVKFSWLFAIAGIVIAVVIAIYETVANRTSGIEIADGVQQAVLAGKVKMADLWEHIDQATFGRAKAIIKKATT